MAVIVISNSIDENISKNLIIIIFIISFLIIRQAIYYYETLQEVKSQNKINMMIKNNEFIDFSFDNIIEQ